MSIRLALRSPELRSWYGGVEINGDIESRARSSPPLQSGQIDFQDVAEDKIDSIDQGRVLAATDGPAAWHSYGNREVLAFHLCRLAGMTGLNHYRDPADIALRF